MAGGTSKQHASKRPAEGGGGASAGGAPAARSGADGIDDIDALPRGASCAALGALVLAVYARTAMAGVGGGDSGELVQVAHALGVAHPPGYPLWTMLAHGFSRLPLGGSVAWRVNLSSAACGAAAAGCLAAATAELGGSTLGGLAAGGLFAFSPHVWTYATHAEVFALHNLLLAVLLLLLVRFDAGGGRSHRLARAGAFVIGLCACNQHTAVFFAAPWAAWAVWRARASARLHAPRALLGLALAGLLGLAPHAQLWARGGSVGAWGSWGDTATGPGLVHHVLRRDYGTFRLSNAERATDAEYAHRLLAYLRALPAQSLGAVGPAAAALGAASLLHARRTRSLALALGAGVALYLGPFFYLSNLPVSSPFFRQIQERFWPQPSLVFFAALGAGLGQLGRHLPCARSRAVRAAVCAALVGAQLRAHFDAHDFSRHELFTNFGAALLDAVPPQPAPGGAAAAAAAAPPRQPQQQPQQQPQRQPQQQHRRPVLLTNGDEVINSVRYAQRCEGRRPDVLVLDLNYLQFQWHMRYAGPAHYPGLRFPGNAYGSRPGDFQMGSFLDANSEEFEFFSAGGIVDADRTWEARWRLWPVGPLMRLVPRAQRIDLSAEWQLESERRLAALAPLLSPTRPRPPEPPPPPSLRAWAEALAAALGAGGAAQPGNDGRAAPVAGSWEEVVVTSHYAQAHYNRAYFVLQVGLELGTNADVLALAARLYEDLAAKGVPGIPETPDHVHRNIGVCHSRLMALETDPTKRAISAQRAAAAFLRYLSYPTVSEADRRQVEAGILGLLAAPPPAGGSAGSAAGARAAAAAGGGGAGAATPSAGPSRAASSAASSSASSSAPPRKPSGAKAKSAKKRVASEAAPARTSA